MKSIKNNEKIRFICIVLVFVAAVLFFENIGLFEGLNNYCYDLAFRLRGQRIPDDRIIIAAVDEKTLARLGRWPVRRAHYAELLEIFSQASAVGIDIIFSEVSDDDALLSRAITRHARVVLPLYIDKQLNVSYPVKILSPAGLGHVHVELGIDGFAREVFHTISYQSESIPSFASALYAVLNGGKHSPAEIRNLPLQHINADNIIQSERMRINFYGVPGIFPYISVADILNGQWSPSFFADKIVLLGKTAAGVRESLLVPFTNGRSRMPGVEVHAHILNNLLDKGSIRSVPKGVRWAFAIVLAVFCFFIFIRLSGINGVLIGFLSLLTLTVVTLVLFGSFNLWIPPASFYVSVVTVFTLAYIFRLNLEIKERKYNETVLLHQRKQLRSLSSELLLTEERERRRIATELHDRIGQTLAVTKIKLGELQAALPSKTAVKTLEGIRTFVDQTIQDTRLLTFELSPPVLYQLGLEAALAWLTDHTQKTHNIRIEFKDDGRPKTVDESYRVIIFQATRELLFNIVKHARAQNAGVSIRRAAGAVRVDVEDDGVGFDTSVLNSVETDSEGFGLFSIRERIASLGGHLEIESEPGSGTRVTLVLPMSRETETPDRPKPNKPKPKKGSI